MLLVQIILTVWVAEATDVSAARADVALAARPRMRVAKKGRKIFETIE
jgi:hypothetical protein